MDHLKALDPAREDIHAPIVILLGDRHDLGGAADPGNSLGGLSHHAERFFLLQAFRDHLPIARFENVQRERYARQQDQIERKDGQQRTHGASNAAILRH